jgi:hypothetical protein
MIGYGHHGGDVHQAEPESGHDAVDKDRKVDYLVSFSIQSKLNESNLKLE